VSPVVANSQRASGWPTFRISMPKYPTKDPHYRILAHQRSRFTHYYFYIRDEVLGDLSAEEMPARIRVVATAASSADRAIVEGIITTAIRSTPTTDLGIVTLWPGARAILFLHMGGHPGFVALPGGRTTL
jgi:hypothetical protein